MAVATHDQTRSAPMIGVGLTTETADGRPLLRDVRALARFDLFLFTAVATILIVRGALAVAGYPQVGGGGLHVAHVLYGGLLMGAAIVLMEVLPGGRTKVRAAVIGGVGFGLFLDEVGKFLTKDVNYFYKPAVTVMYAVFVIFYLTVRELIAHRPLDDRRRLALAAIAVSDLAIGQLDERGRARAVALLQGCEPASMAEGIKASLQAEPCRVPRMEAFVSKHRERTSARVAETLRSHKLVTGVGFLLGAQLIGAVLQLLLILVQPSIGRTHGSYVTDVGAVVAQSVSLVYLGFGVTRFRRHDDLGAMRVLIRSAMISVLFTQLFVFARYQWSGLIGFAGEALLLTAVRAVMHVVHDTEDLGFDGDGSFVHG